MPIAWVDVPDPKNPPAGAPKLNAANLARHALVEDIGVAGTPTGDAGRAAFIAPLPSPGSFTYNADGTVASDPDGNTYTWNTDGTPKTQTKGGVTRTFNWNADGTLGSVS